MKTQVVRAGKYFSVGILIIASLPVLIPLLILLSIFGFTCVLPLGCALAGFLYLRKYVGMLYRKLPITLGGCPSWGRRRPPLSRASPGPPLFIDLPVRDQQAIETFESVDPEFDAVVISTVPREEDRGSVGIGSGPEAVSFSDVSADDAIRIEGADAGKFVKAGITVEDQDDGTVADNGTSREGMDDDSFTENRSRAEAADDDISFGNWTMKEIIHVPTFADSGAKGEEKDVTSAENGTRREVEEDDVSADDETKKEGNGGGAFDFDLKTRAGIDDNRSFDETRGCVPYVDTSAKDGTDPEWKETTSIEGRHKEGERQKEEEQSEIENLNKEKTENTIPSATNREKSFEVPEEFGRRTSGVKQLEENSQQDEVHAKPDESAYPEVEGSEGFERPSVEVEDQNFEAVPNECVIGELGEDQHGKSVSSPAAVITLDSFHEPSENESPTKPDGVGHFLPHQANEDDIWMCKECGWKYPNAKPSAKIRRNHKKQCKGSSPRSLAPEGGLHAEKLSQHNDGVAKLRIESQSIYSLADSSSQQLGEGLSEQNASTEPELEGGKFINSVKADDCSSEPVARGMDPKSDSKANMFQDESGPVVEQTPSAVEEKERAHWSSSLTNDDMISPGHEHHSNGLDLETGGAAISAVSGKHDEELGGANECPSITSESGSSPDEFPHDRWSSFPSVESHYDDEQDQLTQVRQELQLCDDLNAVKGVVGDKHVSTGPLLTDIEELSQFLGIDLPVRSADLPEIEWAKLAIEVMKVVVGID